jgi:hypothetical protein
MKTLHPINQDPFSKHQELINIWENNKPLRDRDDYWEKLNIVSTRMVEYLIELPSSKEFNNNSLQLKPSWIDKDYKSLKVNQSVDVRSIIGHTGHLKLLEKPHYTWEEILRDVLKAQTINYLIEISIKQKRLYYDTLIKQLEFIKYRDEYFFMCTDGLHRIVLAKYILSVYEDATLDGVKVYDVL